MLPLVNKRMRKKRDCLKPRIASMARTMFFTFFADIQHSVQFSKDCVLNESAYRLNSIPSDAQ